MRKNKRWNPSAKWKWSVLKNLTFLANKIKVEAVFPEDFQDLEKLEDAIKFINAYNLHPDTHGNCPLCGSPSVTEGEIYNVMFYGIGKASKELGKLEGLYIRRCENCHAYSLEGW